MVNDLPLLKVVLHIIEGSKELIKRIVKDDGDEEDFFRVLGESNEPLACAISNLESMLQMFYHMGIITEEDIKAIDKNKTSFYENLHEMFISGRISKEIFDRLVGLGDFSFDKGKMQ